MKTAYKIFSAILALAVVIFLAVRLGFEGDTQALIDHAYGAIDCWKSGVFPGCGSSRAGPFVIFQYIPSWFFIALGGGRELILRVLCFLSIAGFLGSLAVMYRGLKDRSVAYTGILILLSGFNLRYVNLSFGEMAASFVTLGFVAGILCGWNLFWVSVLAFWTALTKDMAFPFQLLILGASFYLLPAKRDLRRVAVILAAIFVGATMNSAFNWFRYGSLVNVGYLNPQTLVSDPVLRWNYFFGIWFSPFGGVAIFWPSFMVLLIALLAFVKRKWKPAAAVYVILLIQTAGFSKWYAPFGNIAWGERLMLPWIPALTFWILWFYAQDLRNGFRWLKKHPKVFWGGAIMLAIATFPQYAILLRHSLMGRVIAPASCGPRAADVYCQLWQPLPWGIMEFYRPFPRPDLFVAAAFMSSWVVALSLKARDEK